MTNRISAKQANVLSFIDSNPGVCTADVNRWEWSGRGHAATYARVDRLWHRGFLRIVHKGNRGELYITEKGLAAIGRE